MLDQVARHGMIDLTVDAKGDLHIDGHHTVEDIGITFGQAVKQALGDKAGLVRYGHAYVPLDEPCRGSSSTSPGGPVSNTMSSSPGR
jgi:imidazoleglycerol-phosphate dehydratase